MKVLVIEDDAETAAYIANGLSENGHVVDRASNGREGLFLARGGAYDVAIVDRMLPGLDGLSLVKDLRGNNIRTAVLFLTNLGGIDDLHPFRIFSA
jgi:two-component system, OmpR family, response regulator